MNIPELHTARQVTLEEMLAARDERAAAQQRLLQKHGVALVSFTLNIPGAYKQFPLAASTFHEGVRLISRRLGKTLQTVVQQSHTGSAAFFAVDSPPRQVKEKMVSLEQSLPIGRLFDIDVLDASGGILSRGDLGYPPRACLLCSKPAAQCGRAQAHPVEEVVCAAIAVMRDYFHTRYAEKLAGTALRALLYEVAATPKPGLVDRANNGAHQDMDFFTFADSAAALLPYFRAAVLAGLGGNGDRAALFRLVRHQGQLAEEEMAAATGGVNTHKGIIFSMGLLCAAAGAARQGTQNWQEPYPDEAALLSIAGGLAVHALEDLRQVGGACRPVSNGERIFASHGVGGVRLEAARGFPNVRTHALPALRRWCGAGWHINDAGLMALLHLLAHVEDTNLIHRGGKEAQQELNSRIRVYLEKDPDPRQAKAFLQALDGECIRRNLSPGGCADLLAIAYFLYLYSEEKRERQH